MEQIQQNQKDESDSLVHQKKDFKLSRTKLKVLNTALGVNNESEVNNECNDIDDHSKNQATELENKIIKFWNSRTIDARYFCIYINFLNAVFQLPALISPQNNTHFQINFMYSIGTLLCFLGLGLSSKMPPKIAANITWACCAYLGFRQGFRLLDYERTSPNNQQENMDISNLDDIIAQYQSWFFLTFIYLANVYQIVFAMLDCFQATRFKNCVALILIFMMSIGANNAIRGREKLANKMYAYLQMMIFGTIFFCCNLHVLGKQNAESLGNLVSNFEQKTQLKMIVENIEESIITLQGKRIHIVNESFIQLFQAIIMKEAEDLDNMGQSSNQPRISFCRSLLCCLCCFSRVCCVKSEKKEPAAEHQVQERLIQTKLFTKFKVQNLTDKQDTTDVSEQSIEQIINIDINVLEQIVFEVNQTILRTDDSHEVPKYVQMKVKEYYSHGKKMKLLQITNVTNQILYNEFKVKHQFTDIINSCVSHELRNPLNAIIAKNIEKKVLYKELKEIMRTFQQDFQPIQIQQCIKIVKMLEEGCRAQQNTAEFMNYIIQDLLDFAQIKSGQFLQKNKKFNIREAVQKVMMIQSQKAKDKGIDFRVNFIRFSQTERNEEFECSPIINCDEQRIMQVLLSIQANAIKFTQKGRVLTEVEIIKINYEQYLKISVIDSGIGIPEEDQGKLFKLFGFVQDGQLMNTNGIGLGLMISKLIVEKFDGNISFTSEENVGSSFQITFKLQNLMSDQDEESQPIQIEEIKLPKRNQTNQIDIHKALIRKHNFKKNNDLGKFSQRRILIVDDQSFNIDAMLIILQYSIKIKNCSSICDSAFDGQQALDKVIENCKQNKGIACDYDLILMDCNMPHMDGYESTQSIRQYHTFNNMKQPMIVAVTGHSEQSYINKAIDSGMDQVLSKPIDVEELRKVFQTLKYEMNKGKVDYYLKNMLINQNSQVDVHGGDSEVSQEDDIQFEHHLVPSFSSQTAYENTMMRSRDRDYN